MRGLSKLPTFLVALWVAVSASFACVARGAEKPEPSPPGSTWLLHLTGISGRAWCDNQMLLGYQDFNFPGKVEVYDWTGDNAGISALLAQRQHQEQARVVARLIAAHARQFPADRIILSGHSGGAGIAIWALEQLPDNVKVDTLVLLASALSPDYDLSKGLRHVSGHCYNFFSDNDILVLSVGTRMLGTIDGKKTDASGHVGFSFPAGADEDEYAKLIQKPYDKTWMQYHNIGDHMGYMGRRFVRAVLAPMLAGLTRNEVARVEKPTPARAN